MTVTWGYREGQRRVSSTRFAVRSGVVDVEVRKDDSVANKRDRETLDRDDHTVPLTRAAFEEL